MGRRIIHDNDFMRFVMTPPQQLEAKYDMYQPSLSTMRIMTDGRSSGLGEVPAIYSGGGDQNSWVMPVVIIVVSAMALMTLYAVLSKR
jgi:hypothetical protein